MKHMSLSALRHEESNNLLPTSWNAASISTSCKQHKNSYGSPVKAVNATKPSGMKRRRPRLQRSNVCCQSARLSESIFCLYIFIPCFELWSLVCWKYKHSTHAALWILNRDLTSWHTIKDALNHPSWRSKFWRGGCFANMCANISSRPFQLLATENLSVHWARTEQNPNTFCSFLTGDLVLVTKIWGHDLNCLGRTMVCRWQETSNYTLFWEQTELSSQLWECQTAGVNSFPLVWGTAPCPLPHKSSGPQVFNGGSPRWSSTGAMPH